MLRQLQIQNFTIISELDLEFKSGMTVVTGETGAGKSIIIDALLLALGARSDNKVITPKCDRCVVIASFDLTHLSDARDWLAQHELIVEDGECQLKRVLTPEGPSKGYINGQAVPLQLMRELGAILVNIHGQHEHQALLKTEHQRELLDSYAGHDVLVKKIQQIYSQWHTKSEELHQLQQQSEQRLARLELLTYQLQELEQLNLQKDEFVSLEQQHRQLASADQLLSQAQQAVLLLNDLEEGSVLKSLNKALQLVNQKKELDKKLMSVAELLSNAIIQTEEAVSELNDYCDRVDLSPDRLHKVEQRLSVLHDVARKHRISPENLSEFQEKIKSELQTLTGNADQLEILRQQITELSQIYLQTAQELSKSRQLAGKKLTKEIETSIRQLGMPGGRFEVVSEKVAPDCFMSFGLEKVEFYCSANPGQPMQPLAKVASGGELSRISLAIHVLTAQNEGTPTLIFDEVDVGVGGGTAEIVGKLLAKLSQSAQVFCVTHLPQVAALGQHHFQVSKNIRAEKTQTEIQYLDHAAKIQEIARMLGGVKITQQTLAHAKEMIGVTN